MGRTASTRTEGHAVADPGARIGPLLELADKGLARMQLPSALFSFERKRRREGSDIESVRYSIITLLGLLKAESAGQTPLVSTDILRAAIGRHQRELGVGDTGLLLWADVRRRSSGAEELLDQLDRRARHYRLADLHGMEIGWFVIGAAEAVAIGLPAERLLAQAIRELSDRRSRSSPLVHHCGGGFRGPLPNFATEIYALLALARLARYRLDDRAEAWAVELADTLVGLQLDDGGWPWLFNADLATVVEPYEIYSVHQDAMAPMALLELAEVTGRTEYIGPVFHGLDWCYGNNELGVTTVDHELEFIDRSIRRRPRLARVNLGANAMLGGLLKSDLRVDVGSVDVNETCRPYHLGWVLEAWSGRQNLADPRSGGSRWS